MHFTYAEAVDCNSLSQGDVLRRTPGVEALLREVHPHYFEKPDYPYFIVLTQSCDLVRRSGRPCSSRYITIAAVRPLTLAIRRELASYQYDAVEQLLGFCSSAHKAKAAQFVERLLNNNEPPYFFLEREPSVEFSEEACAFLRLSIAVKAELHYDTLLDAKILQLKESFQHKLGYLVGNLYSRVGTQDWVPDNSSQQEFDGRVKNLIEGLVHWVDKEVHRRVLSELKAVPKEELSDQRLLDAVKANQRKKESTLVEATNVVGTILADLGIAQETIEATKRRLKNQPSFRALIK
jgi:hypothetical protein